MNNEHVPKIFWIHIKKSAGESTRKVLGNLGLYQEVDRVNSPPNFHQVSIEEYNDVLNNYRVVLGDLQFRRCLYAKKYLYHDKWDNILKFGYSREPIDRTLSQFFYLYYKNGWKQLIRDVLKQPIFSLIGKRVDYEFDQFLDLIKRSRESPSNFWPGSLSFQTHTAPMWGDVTGEDNELLLDYIFRLEDFDKGIMFIADHCGRKYEPEIQSFYINKSKRLDNKVTITSTRIKKITELYGGDFELYENAYSGF
jgi:hypothetical protein